MNAYELADKLQMDKARALLYIDSVVQSAEMLRQQAKRIEELEERLRQYECHHGVEGGHACKECYQELTIKASKSKK